MKLWNKVFKCEGMNQKKTKVPVTSPKKEEIKQESTPENSVSENSVSKITNRESN